jgi:hypothetical protein
MLKETSAQADVNRDVGGSDRGMSLATKASFGFMAQNEDDVVQRHHDMRWATITKLIDSEQKMIDVKMKLADSMLGNGLGDQLRMSVILMMDKIDKLNEELALLKNEKRVSNPIVGHVLEHTARLMGMTVVPNPAAAVATVMFVNLKSSNEEKKADYQKFNYILIYLLIAESLLTESSKIICPESCFFFSTHQKFLCIVRTCFVHRGVAIYC